MDTTSHVAQRLRYRHWERSFLNLGTRFATVLLVPIYNFIILLLILLKLIFDLLNRRVGGSVYGRQGLPRRCVLHQPRTSTPVSISAASMAAVCAAYHFKRNRKT